MIKGYVGQVASPWVGKLPAINIEYPEIRTENISGNAAKFSETSPDEFRVWVPDYALTQVILMDEDYNVAYFEEIKI